MSISVSQYTVSEVDQGKRLDVFLMEHGGQSRAKMQRLIEAGVVTIDAVVTTKVSQRIREDQVITAGEMPTVITEDSGPKEDLPLPIIPVVAETAEYIVINKPAGVLVHPTLAEETGTLAHWIRAHAPPVATVGEDPARPGIVHRLDREASGLMVIAKTPAMFAHLKKQFQDRKIIKEYTVLVHEQVAKDHDFINFALDRGTEGRMAARPKFDPLKVDEVPNDQGGKESLTEFDVIKRYTRFTLLKVQIHTGRTHQIRVHFFAYTHPVVGDELYFNIKLNRKRDKMLGRLFLHATRLCFEDLGGNTVDYEAVLPQALEDFLKTLN